MNWKLEIGNWKLTRQGFTLVELMIVVAVLGILAAIVIPEFSGHIQQAKEAAAKDNLRIFREAIERYSANHGIPPGYPEDDSNQAPHTRSLKFQLVDAENYLSEIPKNPFNDLVASYMVANNNDLPEAPLQTDLYGWIYKPHSKTIKLNWEGVDSQGTKYFDY